jgi:hypothetical protein
MCFDATSEAPQTAGLFRAYLFKPVTCYGLYFCVYTHTMRGQTLFGELLQEPAVGSQQDNARKGRSEDLNEGRDVLLAQRYLYYITYTPYRLDIIKERLSQEFWLSVRRIDDVLQERAAYLRQERKAPPKLAQLRARYPHWVWISTK